MASILSTKSYKFVEILNTGQKTQIRVKSEVGRLNAYVLQYNDNFRARTNARSQWIITTYKLFPRAKFAGSFYFSYLLNSMEICGLRSITRV